MSVGMYWDHCWLYVSRAANWVCRSAAGLPVTMPAGSGVQPISPPPPVPTDSGLPMDSRYMFPAMPAAARPVYPCLVKKLTMVA